MYICFPMNKEFVAAISIPSRYTAEIVLDKLLDGAIRPGDVAAALYESEDPALKTLDKNGCVVKDVRLSVAPLSVRSDAWGDVFLESGDLHMAIDGELFSRLLKEVAASFDSQAPKVDPDDAPAPGM